MHLFKNRKLFGYRGKMTMVKKRSISLDDEFTVGEGNTSNNLDS